MNEQNNNSEMTGTGYLVTRVTTALGAIPVEGATVTVRDGMSSINDRGAVIATLTTNKDGLTPKIKLPAPAVLNSTSPGSFFPYASYNIDVLAEGYYRQFFNGVPIYEGITSIQPSMLVPIAQTKYPNGIGDNENYFEENVNPSLQPRPKNI